MPSSLTNIHGDMQGPVGGGAQFSSLVLDGTVSADSATYLQLVQVLSVTLIATLIGLLIRNGCGLRVANNRLLPSELAEFPSASSVASTTSASHKTAISSAGAPKPAYVWDPDNYNELAIGSSESVINEFTISSAGEPQSVSAWESDGEGMDALPKRISRKRFGQSRSTGAVRVVKGATCFDTLYRRGGPNSGWARVCAGVSLVVLGVLLGAGCVALSPLVMGGIRQRFALSTVLHRETTPYV